MWHYGFEFPVLSSGYPLKQAESFSGSQKLSESIHFALRGNFLTIWREQAKTEDFCREVLRIYLSRQVFLYELCATLRVVTAELGAASFWVQTKESGDVLCKLTFSQVFT